MAVVDIGAGAVADPTIHAVGRGKFMVGRPGIATGMAAAAGAVEGDGGVTGRTVDIVVAGDLVVTIPGIHISTPVADIVAEGAIGDIRSIGVAGRATDLRIADRHVVVRGAVR